MIAESAILYPVICLTLIGLIHIIINQYIMLEIKTCCNKNALYAAEAIAGTVRHPDMDMQLDDGRIHYSREGWYRKVMVKYRRMYSYPPQSGAQAEDIKSCCFTVLDESRLLRNMDLVADGLTTVLEFWEDKEGSAFEK